MLHLKIGLRNNNGCKRAKSSPIGFEKFQLKLRIAYIKLMHKNTFKLKLQQ